MKTWKRITAPLFGAILMGAPACAFAAGKVDIGKRDFDANCAVCHGANGKGRGAFVELLKAPMPDLTVLAKNNGGVFPFQRVYEAIDGTQPIKAHGFREMPIWGRHFGFRAAPDVDDYPYDPEAAARGRILTIIDYIYRLQAK